MTRTQLITRLAGAAAVALSALTAVGCGGGGDGASEASPTASGHRAAVGTANARELGTILVDSRGPHALPLQESRRSPTTAARSTARRETRGPATPEARA